MAKSLTEPELKFNFLVFLYGGSPRILTPNDRLLTPKVFQQTLIIYWPQKRDNSLREPL